VTTLVILSEAKNPRILLNAAKVLRFAS
jgi:hypothetical protein